MNKEPYRESVSKSNLPDVLLDFISNNIWSPMVVLQGTAIIAVNEAWAELLGYEDACEPIGTTLADTLSPDSLLIAQQRIADRAAGKTSQEIQVYDCFTITGTPIQVEVSVMPWPLDPNLTVAMVRDVTKREKDMRDLRESEALYRVLAETMPAGVILTDRAGEIVYANHEAHRITGYSLDDLTKGGWFGHPSDDISRQTFDHALINGTSGSGYQTRCVRKDGSGFWAEFCWQSVSDENGSPKWLHVVFTDITRRKQIEQRLARLNECMLSFGADPVANINRLIDLCRELLSAECAFYHHIDDEELVLWDSSPKEAVETIRQVFVDGLIYRDVILNHSEDALVVRDLPESKYAQAGSSVADTGFKTCICKVVKFGGICVGVLSIIYKQDYVPTEDDHRLLGVITGAIGVEEERRRSVEALSRSEERFRHVLDSSRDGIFRIDIRNRCYDYLSPSMIDLLGYSAQEMLEMGSTGLWYRLCPEDQDRVTHELLSTLDLPPDAKLPTLEYRFRHRDGRVVWISDNRTIIRDEDGEPVASVGNIRDITDQKQAEETLKRSEENFRHVLESSRDVTYRLNLQTQEYEYVSPSVYQMLGYTQEEFTALGFYGTLELFHPEDRPIVLDDLELFIRDESSAPASIEYRFKHKNGHYIWLSANRNVIRDGECRPLTAIGNVRDITEKKKSEEALRESENRYRGLVESQRDLIVRVTPDGAFTFVNDAYCRLFGKPTDELLGHSFVPLVHEDDIAATLAAIEKLSAPPYRVNIEQRAMTIEGWRWLAWEDCAILNEHKEIVEIQAVGRDITERRKADEALRKAYDDLAKAYELQREFLNNVTHEVRTPLVAVKGYVDMLLEGVSGPLTSEQADLLKKVLSSSNHLLDIVGGVLEMARLKSGALAVRPKACKPLEIVKKAIDAVDALAIQKGIHVNLHLVGSDCMGLYDDAKIRIILHNLLSNAVKFTLEGGVDIYANCGKNFTEIIVADSGIGISESEQETIFAEFQQLDYPGKHKPTGFGLGLAITSAMVDIIGASLTVSSVKGIGTAFTLCIPSVMD